MLAGYPVVDVLENDSFHERDSFTLGPVMSVQVTTPLECVDD